MTRLDPIEPGPRDGASTLGDSAILEQPLLALACSAKCPPGLVLLAYDLAGALRDSGIPTMSGFHTPIEQDCLHYLLKGTQPVVACPARSVRNMRPKPEWRAPIAEGRMVVVSPFPASARRVTKVLSEARNQFVAEQCSAALVLYATPGGRTEAWCGLIRHLGKPLWTLDVPENQSLMTLGARPVRRDALPDWFS